MLDSFAVGTCHSYLTASYIHHTTSLNRMSISNFSVIFLSFLNSFLHSTIVHLTPNKVSGFSHKAPAPSSRKIGNPIRRKLRARNQAQQIFNPSITAGKISFRLRNLITISIIYLPFLLRNPIQSIHNLINLLKWA